MIPEAVAGRVTMSLIDGVSKVVTLPKPMRTADYVVVLGGTSALSVSVWTSGHSLTGFTLNVSAAIAGTIEYIAHEVTP